MDNIVNNIDISSFKDKTILITGANGLIGGFLSDFFHHLNINYNLNIKLILSSLSESPLRISHLLGSPNVKYISVDLSKDGVDVIDIIDYCFYCAGYAQPSKFMSNPFETISINTVGLFKTANSVFKNKNSKFIYLSSSEIYSSSNNNYPNNETDLITIDLENKRNPYILGKVCGESIVNNFSNIGYNAISVRVSLCYGPGVLPDDTRVLSELVKKGFSESMTIDLFDDGSALRRYIHIQDFTLMLINIALKGSQRVYNVCGEEECTIYELAKIIADKLNKKVKIGENRNLISTSAPKNVWNSLDRYNNEFGKVDYKPLSEGVNEFLIWYKNLNKV